MTGCGHRGKIGNALKLACFQIGMAEIDRARGEAHQHQKRQGCDHRDGALAVAAEASEAHQKPPSRTLAERVMVEDGIGIRPEAAQNALPDAS